jgi:hypothetical protein
MATSFKREHKERTKEPLADDVREKRGGHVHKKHMAAGGALPLAMARRPMGRPAIGNPMVGMMRKKGGAIEKEEMREEREIKSIKKELKHHEHEKASKAHHGLKKGGMAKPGALLGGVEDFGRNSKGKTGDIEGPGYKHGGHVHRISGHPVGSHEHHKHMAKHHAEKHREGGSAHHKKMHEHHKVMCDGGPMHKAHGGSVAKFENTEMHGTAKHSNKHGKTGDLEGVGYKRGGHVSMHHRHHAEGGHVHMHHQHHAEGGHKKIERHPLKKGGKVCW